MHPAPRKRWGAGRRGIGGSGRLLSGGSSDDSGDKSAIGKAKEAVIQIAVTGTFANLEGGTDENQEGRGSGFVISKDGLAVTDNHVVAGATKTSVRVPGKTDPVAAKVLGASECADLAVIDLDGGGFDALQWAKEVPNDLFNMYAQYWVGCKGTPTLFVRSTATPIGRREIIAAETVITRKAEVVALLQSLLTFEFDPARSRSGRRSTRRSSGIERSPHAG